jgi:hypothetical protein
VLKFCTAPVWQIPAVEQVVGQVEPPLMITSAQLLHGRDNKSTIFQVSVGRQKCTMLRGQQKFRLSPVLLLLNAWQ